MATIKAINGDGQLYIVTVEESKIGKQINIMKNKGLFNIKVVKI